MADVERIGVDEARRHVAAGQAMLVCAYDDEAKCPGCLPASRVLNSSQ